jgi:hypothetical protein
VTSRKRPRTAPPKSLKKWRARQNKTANTYVIDITLFHSRSAVAGRIQIACASHTASNLQFALLDVNLDKTTATSHPS